MQSQLASQTRPPITVIDTEAEALFELALAWLEKSPTAAEMLMQELDRAETTDLDNLPPDVVTMLSRVVFVDEGTGEKHEVQLVYPRDADAEQHRVSVMTPIGAALIGMRSGSEIAWPNLAGVCRSLKILEVVQPSTAE